MIKIHLFLVVVACASIGITQAMDDVQASKIMKTNITLPKQLELKRSLRDAGFGDFVAKVKIHRHLDQPELPLRKIINAVDQCINWYDKPPLDWITQDDRQHIL